MLIAVYGSLKRTGHNHGLLESARFVCEALTPPGYTLYDIGGIPGLKAGGTTSALVEVYDVGARTLAALDALEGHPLFYQRAPVVLEGLGTAEIYLWQGEPVTGRHGTRVLKHGIWPAPDKYTDEWDGYGFAGALR